MKKISIITAVKNGMPYMKEALNSFNLQNYENKELIIICTKSEDGTEEFLNNNLNKNIKLFNNNENGIYKAINEGLKKATGEIIGILHSDDIFYSNKILSNISEKFENEKSDLCYGDIVFSKRNNLETIVRVWTEKPYNKNLPKYWTPPHTSVFIKRSEKTNIFYDENYKISSDTKYLLELLKINDLKISYLPGIITVMRAGGISFSYKNFSGIVTKYTEDVKIFINMGFNHFDYLKKIITKIKQIVFLRKKLNYDEKYFLQLVDKDKVIRLIQDTTKINFNYNFILSGLNLAFVAYYFDKKIKKDNFMIHWPDGIFCKRIKKSIKKIPGRELIKQLLIPKQINSIHIIGNISERSKNYLKKLYNIEIKHTNLPYGNIHEIKSYLPSQTSDKELYILTLPTPKQEQCAQFLAQKNKHFKIICIGGAINIASGEESPVPLLLDKLGLEFFWRLKSDTWRRTKRLSETFIIYLASEIKNKFRNLYIKEIK